MYLVLVIVQSTRYIRTKKEEGELEMVPPFLLGFGLFFRIHFVSVYSERGVDVR